MKVLVLNRFGLSAMDYPGWLGAAHEVHLVTSAAAAQGQEDTFDRYASVQVVASYADDPAVELLALDLHDRVGLDALVAMSEFDLLRAARLREAMGLPGQTVPSAEAYRDKLTMKTVLRAGGVPVADHAPIASATDLLAFAARSEGPVVVKPRRGAASVGVHVLSDAEAVRSHVLTSADLRGDDPAHLLAEEFVPHELVHVDGAWRDGKVVLAWPSRSSSQLGFRDGEVVRSAMLDLTDDGVEPALAMVERALATLPTPDVSLFHAELFRTADGAYLVNEIGCRMGGARIKTAMEVAHGVNLEEWYVRNALGDTVWDAGRARPEPLSGFAIIPPRPGRLDAAPSECPLPGVRRFKVEVELGAELTDATCNGDAMASITVEGADAREVVERLDRALAWAADSLVVV